MIRKKKKVQKFSREGIKLLGRLGDFIPPRKAQISYNTTTAVVYV